MSLICGPYNPENAVTSPVWAAPLSLATTRGITLVFSSSAYLDVSVRRVRLLLKDAGPSARRVAPFGNPGISTYLQLHPAYRSLSRPSSPPGALASPVRPWLLCQPLTTSRFNARALLSYSCFSSVARYELSLIPISRVFFHHVNELLPSGSWRIRESNP